MISTTIILPSFRISVRLGKIQIVLHYISFLFPPSSNLVSPYQSSHITIVLTDGRPDTDISFWHIYWTGWRIIFLIRIAKHYTFIQQTWHGCIMYLILHIALQVEYQCRGIVPNYSSTHLVIIMSDKLPSLQDWNN